MATKTIDIPLPPDLEEFLKKPVCIPMPQPGKVEINLPMGGTLKGVADITKSIPDDCTLSFSLVLQLAPFLANLDCLFKIVKVIQPMLDVVTGLGKADVPKVAGALPKLIEAAPPLIECISKFTGVGIPLFVRDLLCLIIKLLSCIVGQLKSIMNVIGGLAIQIQSAQAAGNTELLAALECSQKNAQTSAQHMVSAIEPIVLLLSFAEPFLGIAGVDPIKIPAVAAPDDLGKMQDVVNTLDELVKTLKLAAEVVGGC
ncbi:MAG: hypothetical protein JSR29_20065 [Nitrospira sp.]|nr:hypothetical protein [Nitrospira sp.]